MKAAFHGAAFSADQSKTSVSRALVYIALVKPWIIGLVLVSTLGGMFIAGKTLPDISLIIWTLIGVGLATAASAALNNTIDADIDSKMTRTAVRPTASGAIDLNAALKTGLLLTFLSTMVMALGTNPIASGLTTASIFIYVVIYTYCLKRTTPLATYVGGIAGALPPVIGYAAVNQMVNIEAMALFLILYTWQHPHFWSLALKYRSEYEKAGVNNLPVAAGVDETKKQIVVWAAILAPVSILPYILGMTGLLYFGFASFMGALFLAMAVWFFLSIRTYAMSLFFFSIVHLATLFCMMVIDIV